MGKVTPEGIARLCLKHYEDLSKAAKPTDSQWTVLAGIVIQNVVTNECHVASLGLGTKCIGAKEMCPHGFILNDSHAEVLARRGFLRYLYREVRKAALNQDSSIVEWDNGKSIYRVKSVWRFHFFCTKTPCGDACIVDESLQTENETPAKRSKLSIGNENEASTDKWHEFGTLLISSAVYTGAKLLEAHNENVDCMAQTSGALRIKPGKGDRTLSMSCSDKLSKWCILGVQGALLNVLLEEPVYFCTMTFLRGSNITSLKRAICDRWGSKLSNLQLGNFKQIIPTIEICSESVQFRYAPELENKRTQPSPIAVVWSRIPEQLKPCEISVNGKRQGCVKKLQNSSLAALKISKYHLLQEFVDILSLNIKVLTKSDFEEKNLQKLSLREAKNLARRYQHAWLLIKSKCFGKWTEKPRHLIDFSLQKF